MEPTPLNSHRYLFETEEDDEVLIVRPMGNFEFVPVVSSRLSMVAALRITLLRPEPHGNIVTQGGDMANRLTPLLGAPKVANRPNALPGRSARGGRVALLVPSRRR